MRGVIYLGALEALDELGLVEGIQRVTGTSAGAIAATLASLRLNVPETKALFDTLVPSLAPTSIMVYKPSDTGPSP